MDSLYYLYVLVSSGNGQFLCFWVKSRPGNGDFIFYGFMADLGYIDKNKWKL